GPGLRGEGEGAAALRLLDRHAAPYRGAARGQCLPRLAADRGGGDGAGPTRVGGGIIPLGPARISPGAWGCFSGSIKGGSNVPLGSGRDRSAPSRNILPEIPVEPDLFHLDRPIRRPPPQKRLRLHAAPQAPQRHT